MTSISRPEFIAMTAMMMATVAFSVDAMLPALPEIAGELSPDAINRAQLVVTAFVAGMGLGTFFVGPLSDAFGRKPVIIAGCAVYVVAAFVSTLADSLDLLLLTRFAQGLGASGPRVVSIAIMRDLHSGRTMARMLSIVMMIFVVFPAFAPLIGTGIIAVAGWRSIFIAFILFSAVSTIWMTMRLPEPLPAERRRPFRLPLMLDAVKEMMGIQMVRLSITVQTLCMAIMFAMIPSVQPVYDQLYHRADEFPFWFAAVAVVTASASFLNAALVMRLGMRKLVTWTISFQLLVSGLMIIASHSDLSDAASFGLFVFWQASVFFMVGTALGNLNALAMEPVGHIAGMAASVIGAISTVLAAVIASPIGLMFNGTIRPLAAGIFVFSLLGFLLMLRMRRLERIKTAPAT